MNLDRERSFWKCAGKFPPNKEEIYPDHAAAVGFDEIPVGRRVLEYGCGGGADAMSWARREQLVWYSDVVEENVLEASKRIQAAGLSSLCTPWKLEASDRWPRGDWTDFFDVVHSHGVLHHIEDPRSVLRAMRSAIKTSGRLVVMLYSPKLRESFEENIRRFMKMDPPLTEGEAFGWCTDGQGCPYARGYSVDETRELLRETGFRLMESRPSHKGLFITHHAVPA